MRPRHAQPGLPTLILLSALSILPISLFLPSLASIAAEFQADYALVSLALAGYAAVSAVLQSIMGPLSDRFGRRPIALTGLGFFVVASFGCAMAADVWTFLAWRLLQAAIASGFSVSLAVIRDTTSKELAASKIGYVAMAWAVAPMFGPSVGGLLDETLGWRSSFWLLGVLGIAVLSLCWFDLSETNAHPSRTIGQQFRAYPELLRSRRFWAYTLCMAFSAGTFYAFLAGAPLAATVAFGMSAATIGMFMGTITAGFMFGSFLSGRFASRFPLVTTMLAGRIIACTGLALGLLLFVADVVHAMALFGPCMFVGIGNGLTLPSANTGALSVRPNLTGSAAGLAGSMSVAGGAAMSSVTGMVLTESNAGYALLLVMLASALAALVAAVYAGVLERREGKRQ